MSREAKEEAESGATDGLKTHTCEYFTGTRASTNKNGITKEPQMLASFPLVNERRYKLQTRQS